jgi:hypothetical protein
MKAFTLALSAAVLSANAFACPVADKLADRYGISFSGFDTPIPSTQEPDARASGPLVSLPLREATMVSDGFRHTVVLSPASKKAWILRTGGFAGVYEWYGPVDVGDMPLADCRPAAASAGAPQQRKEAPAMGPA